MSGLRLNVLIVIAMSIKDSLLIAIVLLIAQDVTQPTDGKISSLTTIGIRHLNLRVPIKVLGVSRVIKPKLLMELQLLDINQFQQSVSRAMVRKFLILSLILSSFSFSQISPHGKIKFECKKCHTVESWKYEPEKVEFKHSETGFALLGQHKIVKCEGCHKKLVFSGLTKMCSSCHGDFHEGTLGGECQRCHGFDTWKIDNFREKHNMTRFVLTGVHKNLDCLTCHKSLVQFSALPLDCAGCHKKDYDNARSPNHSLARFNLNCVECHKASSLKWSETTFIHPDKPLRLDGKHAVVECYKCHNGIFAGTPSECFSCHQADYVNALKPNHVEAQISHECKNCHTTVSFRPSTFDHNSTGFILTGAHMTAQCSSCHKGVFAGTPRDCWSCHESNYNLALNPNHRDAGFSHNCVDCHTTDGWRPATFDHSRTNFPLTGKHLQVQCSSCHKGVFAGTPKDCWSCHESNYNSALIPVHTVGYPRNCEMCHTSDGWRPSSFNHDSQYFRIYSGKHSFSRGRWKLCVDCHPSAPGSFNDFTCTSACHPQDKMAKEHRNVQGYIYNSPNCYNCHRGV